MSGEFGSVDREFTCTACGFATTHDVPLLQAAVHGVCSNCGDWTTHLAGRDTLAAAAREAADALAGPTLTERQALAHLLRDVLDVDRQTAADVMDTSASNVDNLQRTARKKLDDAKRVLDGLAEISPTE